MMPVKRLSLTDFKATIPRGAREKTLKAALDKDGIMAKFQETAWGKKLKVKESRKSMSDFDRFKLYKAKQARSKVVKKSLKTKK